MEQYQNQDQNHNNKKEIFSELRDSLYKNSNEYNICDIKISSLKNKLIIDEIKNLKIVELDNLGDFLSCVNYDYFMIFKYNNFYYFCDTELASYLGEHSLIKITDFNLYLRKDKINNIENFD